MGILPTTFNIGGFPIEGVNEVWVDKDDFDKHGAGYESDKFYQENDVKNTKSVCVSSEN